jgi:hypothetical protein
MTTWVISVPAAGRARNRVSTANGNTKKGVAKIISSRKTRAIPASAAGRGFGLGSVDGMLGGWRSEGGSAMTHPPGRESAYQRTPLSAAEKTRAAANFVPYVVQILAASGRFRVSADTPDQVELFQGVARRVSAVLQQPVVSYANGREIVITFGQEDAPGLAGRGTLEAPE